MSLKGKTISGILWSSVDNFITQGIAFIVGIILARLLTPEEFGLIGMIAIFIAVSESFIRSGFHEALIRKKDCSNMDYSTVFYYNLLVGLLFFLLLYIFAPAISSFFEEPELKNIIRVLSLVLIVNALTIIQRTILTKRVDFKLLTRISVIASGGSGVLAITLAYKGFGVWSLVALQLSKQVLNSLLLWLWNRWRPSLGFSKDSFKQLFSFGSKLMVGGLIDTTYQNIYYLVIGKFFSAGDLGYYTRAQIFSRFPSHNINMVMSRVTYPVLAEMQDKPDFLREGYRRLIRSIMLLTFILMLGLAAVAEPMVITLIGEKWRPSIIYLQMLCFAGMLYPLHALNLNMLKVQGRSGIILRLEIIKKTLTVPIIIIGIIFGIKIMIAGMILNSFVDYYLNSYYSGKYIGYGTLRQVRDIMPSFLLAAGMAAVVFTLGCLLKTSYPVTLVLQIVAGAVIVFAFCEITRMEDYIYLKSIIVDKLLKKK
ncbi:MAG: lipopolysaccharide biosynthesis protein [Bacteroidota bacterium]